MSRFGRASEGRLTGFSRIVIFDGLFFLLLVAVTLLSSHARALSMLRPIAMAESGFWRERFGELCESDGVPVPPDLSRDAEEGAQIMVLRRLWGTAVFPRAAGLADSLWAAHLRCVGPVVVVINEDLLRFAFNEFDRFVPGTNPEGGFERICGYVDENIRIRNEVYVLGHTDDVGDEEYNYILSYRRAMRVSSEIRSHLGRRGLVQGRDYLLYSVGMGESRLLPRDRGSSIDDWQSRCRRIELSFRAPTPTADRSH